MNLRHIDFFRQVMQSRNMTAAALELGSSQPTVSRTISELERSLGFSLFERYGGRVTPTESAEAFFREVENSFRGLDRLAQAAREIRNIGTGRLRIAAVPSMALTLMPQAISQLKSVFPNIAVSLEMRTEQEIARWVSASYCDVGFTSFAPDHGEIDVEPLYSMRGVCVLPAKHRLSKRKKLRLNDLVNESIIIPSSFDTARSQIDTLLQSIQLAHLPTVESPYAALICKLVAQGLGVAIVNPLAAVFGETPHLTYVPITPTPIYRGYVARSSTHIRPRLAERFVEIVQEILASNMAPYIYTS